MVQLSRHLVRYVLSGTVGRETLPPSPLLPPPQAGNIPRDHGHGGGGGSAGKEGTSRRVGRSSERVRWIELEETEETEEN